MESFLKDKTILITGGTSRLGQAFVRKAVQHGAHVFFTYFADEETARQLELLGARGSMVDFSSAKTMDEFAGAFKAKNERLDVLIHNAAMTSDFLIEKMPEKEWDRVMTVNLKAPFYLTKQLLPALLRKTPSKIFTIVSRAGLSGLYGAANYAASKGGLIAMTKSLAKELGRKKILVNAVNPGFMKSSMTAAIPEEILQKNLEMSPLKSFSDPEEVADFLVYLSSDLMRQVTGQVFHFESRPL
ncbi:MAG TPA: SDR family oxidoreductase [Candidatus Omnitrophota bacterium]|nr:SDR family oxidoreductase [Candidatus Omnitrophota bacterium]HPS36573.1 SDR family oxidoreductase [Candidatus Omnitrophota bacterium]